MRTTFTLFTLLIVFALSPNVAIAQQGGEGDILPPSATTPAAKPVRADMQTEKQQKSYAIGYDFGTSLRNGEADVDIQLLAKGIAEALAGQKSPLTDKQLGKCLQDFEAEMTAKYKARVQKKATDFLATNKAKPGVQVTKSGLQYKVIKKGTGAMPKATDTVKVHYHGTHTDGRVFDSSVQRGRPTEFPVNRVISGWTEALQLMHVGDKWQLVIPSDLAYGVRGTGDGTIGPGEVLVFEVELLGISK